MKSYKVVLFDLDHTLWDFNRNSHETLGELFQHHKLDQLNGLTFDQFHNAFNEVNAKLWYQYDRGLLDRHVIRNQRFSMVFESVNIKNDEIASRLSADYLVNSPTKKHLLEGALDVLNYLKLRYPLYVVTNGFTEQQSTKARSGGIEHYFQSIVTSELAGYKKPAKEIFDFVLQLGNFSNQDAIMIGDNLLTDIAGATDAGIDTVYFNPDRLLHQSTPTHEINQLTELKSIL